METLDASGAALALRDGGPDRTARERETAG
jgi:hypothetical protein